MIKVANDTSTYFSYIHGEWIPAKSDAVIKVENPANAQVFAQVPDCSVEDAERALQSAEQAFHNWKVLPAIQRAQYLFAIIDKLLEKRAFFARLLVQEQGKTLKEAYGEVDDTAAYLRYAAEAARRLEGQIFPADNPNEQLWIHKVPYGVVVGLCAFNYPLALIGRKVGPALVAGNTIVLKPHEATPVTALEFCKILDEIKLPPGVINVVTGAGATIGSHLVQSPITKLITVTGSIRTGQHVYRGAAENITAVSLELGGKAPFIVLEDADLDKAVDAAVVSRFANCGQVCVCNEWVLVHEKVAKEFTQKLAEKVKMVTYGDPMTDVQMGPSVTAVGLKRIDKLVQDSLAQGATLACGGRRPDGAEFQQGNWYEPTVLLDVTPDMPVAQEEIFGPVLPVITISNYEEAIELANARNDGLSAYLFTQNYQTFMHAIQHLDTGTIFINKPISGNVQGYHNGHKRSGIGGEDGIYGIEGYLQKRTIYLDCS